MHIGRCTPSDMLSHMGPLGRLPHNFAHSLRDKLGLNLGFITNKRIEKPLFVHSCVHWTSQGTLQLCTKGSWSTGLGAVPHSWAQEAGTFCFIETKEGGNLHNQKNIEAIVGDTDSDSHSYIWGRTPGKGKLLLILGVYLDGWLGSGL